MEGYGNENPGAFPIHSLRARLPPRQAPSSMPYFNPCALAGHGVALASLAPQPALCGARRRGNGRIGAGRRISHPTRFFGVDGKAHNHDRISTHAPCGARRGNRRMIFALHFISTHARPLRGATTEKLTTMTGDLHFQPTRPCGARQIAFLIHVTVVTFQPTLRARRTCAPSQYVRTLRGATNNRQMEHRPEGGQLTHAPCGRDKSRF